MQLRFNIIVNWFVYKHTTFESTKFKKLLLYFKSGICPYYYIDWVGINRHLHYCSLQQNPHHGSLESPGIFCFTNLTRINSKIVMSFEDVELLKYSSFANSSRLWSSPVDLGTNSIFRVRLVFNYFFWNRTKL